MRRAVQRKRFRVEDMLAEKPAGGAGALAAVLRDGDAGKLSSGAAELAAVMQAIEQACETVLGIAEHIEDNAKSLAAAAGSEDTRRLAEDIRVQMSRIFAICHFHDVAGQRIGKVIALLSGLDGRLSGFAGPPVVEAPTPRLVNGPRLDGASGHVSQDEVDALLR
jgi:chemotaxis protein CheZ